MANLSRKVVYYGLFAVLFTPLIVFRSFWSPTNFGKVIVFRVIIELLTVFWFFLILKDRTYRPRYNLISWAFLFFVFSYLASSFFGVNLGQSFWGGFERMGGAFNLIHYFLFFLMLGSVMRAKRDWLFVLNLSLLVGAFSIIYGFLQLGNWQFILGALKSGTRDRIFGTIGNPAMFAGYLLFIIYLALFLGLGGVHQFSRRMKLVYFAIAFLASTALIMTAVRGAILALAVSLSGFFIWYLTHKLRKKLWKSDFHSFRLKIVTIAVLILLVFAGFFSFQYSRKSELVKNSYLLNRIVNVDFNQTTIQQRLLVWGEAWRGFKERPIWGYGPENFTLVHEKYFNPKIYRGASGSIFDRAHNMFFDTLATQGIIGLLSLVFLLASVFVVLTPHLKRTKNLAVGQSFSSGGRFPVAFRILGFLFIAYLIQGFFFFDTFSVYLMISVVLAMIGSGIMFGSSTSKHESGERIIEDKKARWLTQVLIIPVTLGSALLIYYFSFLPVRANNLSAKAAANFSVNNYETGLNQWKRSLSYPLPESYRADIRLNVEPVYIDSLYKISDNLTKEKIASDLDYLINQFTDGIKDNPGLIENYTGLNQLYLAYASFVDREKFNDSIKILTQASEIGPNLIHIWLELGNIHGFKGDYPQAVKSFKKAYALNPDYLPAGFLLVRAYVADGQGEKGISLAEDLFRRGHQNLNDLIWLGGYLKTSGQIGRLIRILEFMSQKDPNYLIYLAIAYKDAGDLKNAKKTADFMLNYEEAHPGAALSKDNYNILAELYLYLKDIKSRTRAFEKSGVLTP